jgi:hypothetical protein
VSPPAARVDRELLEGWPIAPMLILLDLALF